MIKIENIIECMRPGIGYGVVRGFDDFCSYEERREDA